ncbi:MULTISPECIES: formyltransferase family protein [unclassified Janthinobacterium]|uniref:formyltransferase family protein n=1 Tax=unclassified Janthinobacterium TaxID=2610881 RepID=UPI000347CD1D|nr:MULTISPECIES: formyltransferase family protein [unclassified Janthinobacterium]MEC5161354.1 folate-dependent phosphoribosylglycinamide formyltransferase PurN [Janthinobacterium sp. CG_S6]
MSKAKIVYICSLRNAAADQAGQYIEYKEERRYMKSPLEYLVEELNETSLGQSYTLEAVIYDDDEGSPRDRERLAEYGFRCEPGKKWLCPAGLQVQGRDLDTLMQAIPSTYRRHARGTPEHVAGKRVFEANLLAKLNELGADLVLLDGLLIILDELVRPGCPYHRRIVNIHPGITRLESPYERRGAWATLNALYGARGQQVRDWSTMETVAVPPVLMTGASFHYVDNGIDSGEVIVDVLKTEIDPEDTILELRWNNFKLSLFPAMQQGLTLMAGRLRKAA